MSSEIFSTQLGGKFIKEDTGIFMLKKHLVNSGITVSYPEGDSIVAEYNGIPVTFDVTNKQFYKVELDYLRSIRKTPFHIVYNKNKDIEGYIGESAGIEMLFAFTHHKPVVVLYEPLLSHSLWSEAHEMISRNIKHLFIQRIDLFSNTNLQEFFAEISQKKIIYDLSNQEKNQILFMVHRLIKIYKSKI
jgi:hypothetical protein